MSVLGNISQAQAFPLWKVAQAILAKHRVLLGTTVVERCGRWGVA
jgi:hypothetical protein